MLKSVLFESASISVAFLSLLGGHVVAVEVDSVVKALERAAINDNKAHDVDIASVFWPAGMSKSADIILYLQARGFVPDLTILPGDTVVSCDALRLPVGGFGVILDRPAGPQTDWIRVFVVTDNQCNASAVKVGRMQPIEP